MKTAITDLSGSKTHTEVSTALTEAWKTEPDYFATNSVGLKIKTCITTAIDKDTKT